MNGLLAYYPFNGNPDDASGNGNNGVTYGAVLSADRFEQVAKAYSFNGADNFIDAGTSDVFNFNNGSGNFTIDAWIRPDSMPSFASGIVGKTTHGTDPYTGPFSGWAFYYYNDGKLAFGGAGVWEVVSTVGTIAPGNWLHVAVTKNGGMYRLYKNGVEVGSRNYGDLQTSTTALRIGTSYADAFRINGAIDELAVYGRALNGAEIKTLADSRFILPDQTATFNAGTSWTVIASPATAGEGDTTYDNQNIRVSGATFTVNGQHSFKNIELLNGAVLTHSTTTDTTEYRLDIDIWTLSIDSASRLDLTGSGYRGGRANVWYDSARTYGNTSGSTGGAGGSFGGLGSVYDGGRVPNPVYGADLTNPLELGSGGGAWGNTGGGAGGGAAGPEVNKPDE